MEKGNSQLEHGQPMEQTRGLFCMCDSGVACCQSQLIVLTCISFFNELRFIYMRGGDIHCRTFFVILCIASMKRNGQSATTYTLLNTYKDIFRWKSRD